MSPFQLVHQLFFIPSLSVTSTLDCFVSLKYNLFILLLMYIPRPSVWLSNCLFIVQVSVLYSNVEYMYHLTVLIFNVLFIWLNGNIFFMLLELYLNILFIFMISVSLLLPLVSIYPRCEKLDTCSSISPLAVLFLEVFLDL